MPGILIVDDEAPIRALLRSAMAKSSALILEADCGRRALEIAAQYGPFEAVITDILMPGMDGFDLAHALKRGGYAQNFLFMSGYYDPELMSGPLQDFPGAAFLAKPFAIPELRSALSRLFPAERPTDRHMRRSA